MASSQLINQLKPLLGDALTSTSVALGEVTCEVTAAEIKNVCVKLRDELGFEMLVDLCGMDYLAWGKGDDEVPGDGMDDSDGDDAQRFAVVYHLLSVQHNSRLRLRARLDGDAPAIDSVTEIYPAADWYEREAFDLFGILFNGHPDLRRLLTDYGFIGHPMRKDFPLSGQVEMRYDEEQGRVIYQPVTIPPRILVPRTIGDAPHPDEKVNRQAD